MNITSIVTLAVIAAVLAVFVAIRHPNRFGMVWRQMRKQGGDIVLRVPLALSAAALIAMMIPVETVGSAIGSESGLSGILVASVAGALLPGGPMVSFPLALMVWQLGAGQAQMVALLTAWSVFGFHRVLAYEWPLMGGWFVLLRLSSSWMLPPLAGLIAAGILALLLA